MWSKTVFFVLVQAFIASHVALAQSSCSGIFEVFAPLSKDPQAQSFCSSRFSKGLVTSTTSTTTTVTTTTTNTIPSTTTATTTTTVTTTSVVTASSTVNYGARKKRSPLPQTAASSSVVSSDPKLCKRKPTTTTSSTTSASTKSSTSSSTRTTQSTTRRTTQSTTKSTTQSTGVVTTTRSANPLASLSSLASALASSACECITPPPKTVTTTATITTTSTVSTSTTSITTQTSIVSTTTTTTSTTTVTSQCPSASPDYCSTGCTNLDTDPNNCGTCSTECGSQGSGAYVQANVCGGGNCNAPSTCGNTVHICGQNSASPVCGCRQTVNPPYACITTTFSCVKGCNSNNDCDTNSFCLTSANCYYSGYAGGCSDPADYPPACYPVAGQKRGLDAWDDFLMGMM